MKAVESSNQALHLMMQWYFIDEVTLVAQAYYQPLQNHTWLLEAVNPPALWKDRGPFLVTLFKSKMLLHRGGIRVSGNNGFFGEVQSTCLQMKFSQCTGGEQRNVNGITDCQLLKARLGAVKLAVYEKASRSHRGRKSSLLRLNSFNLNHRNIQYLQLSILKGGFWERWGQTF